MRNNIILKKKSNINILHRKSNLELLRILSMILVMLSHYLHLRMPTDVNMIVNNPIKALFNFELHSVSIVCVHCFILISGYFGIRWKLKSFFGLLFQIIFWLCVGYVIAVLLNPYIACVKGINSKDFIISALSWLRSRWFVSAYITLYILSPMINSFIENMSDKQLLRYILIFYAFSTIYGYFLLSEEFATGLSAISLLGLYLIGAWLRRSKLPCVNWNKWYDLIAFYICTLILTGISFFLIRIGFNKSIYGYLNPIVIVESIFLFQYFRKIQIGYVPIINFLASGAFSAFLLHCHPLIADYCYILWEYCHQLCDFAVIIVLFTIIGIYIFSILIDKLRQVFWNHLYEYIYLIYKKYSSINYLL